MAFDLRTKKLDVVSEGVALAKRLLAAIADANEWNQTLTANNFQQGGANEIVQDDIPAAGTDVLHMTPASIQNLRTICTAVVSSLNATQRDQLRQVARGVMRSQ